MKVENFKRKAGLLAINSGFPALFRAVAPRLRRLSYFVEYAAWYRDNRVKAKTISTDRAFGRQNRYALYESVGTAMDLFDKPIDYLEFGVAEGYSLRWWVAHNAHPESTFTGFDTFTGLPEDWGTMPKGTFSTDGKTPEISDTRCRFEVGLFQETLLTFLSQDNALGNRKVLHIDCDIYSAALYVLTHIEQHLQPSDVIFFDEFSDPTHEFRAFLDFAAASGRRLSVIAAANGGHKLALRVEP